MISVLVPVWALLAPPPLLSDDTALAMGIVEAIRYEAGLTDDSPYRPAASGSFLLVREDIVDSFTFLVDSSAAMEVVSALETTGYAFADPESLVRVDLDSAGREHRFFENDAVIGKLYHVRRSEQDATATVGFLFTYTFASGLRTLCYKLLDVTLRRMDEGWHRVSSEVLRQC